MKNTNNNNIADIYNRYVDDLFTYASYLGFPKETTMDAIHDVFCKLAEDEQLLERVSNKKSYLFKSLKNRLYDIYRIQKHDFSLSDIGNTDELPFNINVSIEDDLIDVEERANIRKQIENMLQSLTARQREIVYLRYIQEYDYPQIADILNISIHGCRKLLSKAMETLRKKYGSWIILLLLP
ncbi:MAG: RNA polymerase sigma factor [Bacteroidota bacterium]|jgi:RNA polymerase sigma factor (sigma-70 family)|nr:RNA polymerase subunit sigma-70 [Dysgonamonadaceae bacterium]